MLVVKPFLGIYTTTNKSANTKLNFKISLASPSVLFLILLEKISIGHKPAYGFYEFISNKFLFKLPKLISLMEYLILFSILIFSLFG